MPVFQWHDDTFDLPPGAVHLASSERYRMQAFRHGGRAWGLQFHLEANDDIVRQWLRDSSDAERPRDGDSLVKRTERHLPLYKEVSYVFLQRFLRI
jgi:GMP synthase-like glutamine amidotransferase